MTAPPPRVTAEFVSVARPSGSVYRVGRKEDPFTPPRWQFALPDGTFGGRFDDPSKNRGVPEEGRYRVVYCATPRKAAIAEALAPLRQTGSQSSNDTYTPVAIDLATLYEWVSTRSIAAANIIPSARFFDLNSPKNVEILKSVPDIRRVITALRISDLELEIGLAIDYTLTREIARYVSQLADEDEQYLFAGLRYRARVNEKWHLWALFYDRFTIARPIVEALRLEDPDLIAAAAAINLEVRGLARLPQVKSKGTTSVSKLKLSNKLGLRPIPSPPTKSPRTSQVYDGNSDGIDGLTATSTPPSYDPTATSTPIPTSTPPSYDPTATSTPISIPLPQRYNLPSYSADSASDEDRVGIKRDVEAFAQLIAAHQVAPPLSIGVFGDWGSGKSFFMRQLIKRVQEITAEAREDPRPQRELSFYRHIVQIEFNAWQYMQGNLWAGLVEHILTNLRVTGNEDEDAVQKLQERLLTDLQTTMKAQQEASMRVQEAESALEKAELAVAEAKERYDEASYGLQQSTNTDALKLVFRTEQVQTKIKQITDNLGITKSTDAIENFQVALAEAQAVTHRANSLVTPLIRDKGWKLRLLGLIAVLVGTAIGGALIYLLTRNLEDDWFKQLATLISSVTVFVAGATTWIRSQSKWVSDRIGEVENVKEQVAKLVEQKEVERRKYIVRNEKELELAKEDYAAAQQAKVDAEQHISQVKVQLEGATPARMLANFIQERVESTDYHRHLGILALVRQDFNVLSKFIEQENKRVLEEFQTKEEEGDQFDCRINRIVLYIDDLDRCPPDKVIEVLQAVHLLLGLPLFVVVVAVDVRWMEHALRSTYSALSGGSNGKNGIGEIAALPPGASPRDYLEKIFQIPFWINPISEKGRQDLLTGLLENSIEPAEESIEQSVASQMDKEQDDTTDDATLSQGPGMTTNVVANQVEEPVEGEVSGEETLAGNQGTPPEDPGAQVFDLAPGTLRIYPQELAFMRELAPLLGRSPRSIKRFLNIYRLIKAGLLPEEEEQFLPSHGATGEFKIALFLLAIVTGTPVQALEVFNHILSDFGEGLISVDQWNSIASKHKIAARADTQLAIDTPGWEAINKWLENTALIEQLAIERKKLVKWVHSIARYSFVYETDLLD